MLCSHDRPKRHKFDEVGIAVACVVAAFEFGVIAAMLGFLSCGLKHMIPNAKITARLETQTSPLQNICCWLSRLRQAGRAPASNWPLMCAT